MALYDVCIVGPVWIDLGLTPCSFCILTSYQLLEAFCFGAVHETESVLAWSYAKILLAQYLVNCLWELHQIYSFGAVGDKDGLIRCWGQKVKGQGHTKSKCSFPVEACPSMVRRQTLVDGCICSFDFNCLFPWSDITHAHTSAVIVHGWCPLVSVVMYCILFEYWALKVHVIVYEGVFDLQVPSNNCCAAMRLKHGTDVDHRDSTSWQISSHWIFKSSKMATTSFCKLI